MSLFTNLATAGGALGFKPTALYSFEYIPRQRKNDKVEMFMLVPPEQYSMQYGYRMTVHKTIGSTVVDWSGVDNPVIQLGGSLWSYWLDQLPAPFGNNLLGNGKAGAILNNFASGLVNKAATALASAVSNFFPLNQMSGLDEFFRIKFMLYDFWQKDGLALEPGLTSDQLVPTSLNTLGQLPVDGIFGGMRKLAKMSLDNNLYDIQFVYHDYDDNIHWEVVPQNFQVSRDKNDPFTARWSVSLVGIRDVRKQPYFVPPISKKFSADQAMKDIATALVTVNPVNVFQRSVQNITADYKELRKLSWGGVLASYEIALSDYFNGFASNQDVIVAQSDAYAAVARAAILEAVRGLYGMDASQYKAASESNSPSLSVIQSGYADIFIAIANFLQYTVALSGIKGYTGVKFPIINSNSDSTLQDLAPLDEEFFSGTSENTIQYSDYGWVSYTVMQGDTLGSIAIRKLGDYSRFPEIARVNDLKLTDFALGGMVGKTIKLPIEKKSVFNKTGNLVYWKHVPKNPTIQSLQDELIGRDLYLSQTRDFVVDNSGDLKCALPGDGFRQNITDAVSLPQGILPLYPEWGNPIQVGQVNVEVDQKVLQNKFENVVYADPRVRAVSTDVTKTKQIGDALYFESRVEPLVGIVQTI